MMVLDLSVSKIAAQFGATKQTPGTLVHISLDIVFDQGNVWMTNWQFTQVDILAFQGKKVTLKFFATDAGDI